MHSPIANQSQMQFLELFLEKWNLNLQIHLHNNFSFVIQFWFPVLCFKTPLNKFDVFYFLSILKLMFFVKN